MKRMYDIREVSKLIGVSESQVRYWDKVGMIPATGKSEGRLLFDFKALVAFRTVKALQDKGVSTRKIRKFIDRLRKRLPDASQPLSEYQISIYGDEIVVSRGNQKITPEGQILIDFDAPLPLAGRTVEISVDAGDELFFQALELEDQGELKAAEQKYAELLATRPEHADALVNLGNIKFRLGDAGGAECCYRSALCINPNHVEGNFNLANLFEDRGELDNAVLFFTKAIHEDPEFPDAHYNLGMVLDRMGNREKAKKHWMQYVALDPESQWAAIVRTRLEE